MVFSITEMPFSLLLIEIEKLSMMYYARLICLNNADKKNQKLMEDRYTRNCFDTTFSLLHTFDLPYFQTQLNEYVHNLVQDNLILEENYPKIGDMLRQISTSHLNTKFKKIRSLIQQSFDLANAENQQDLIKIFQILIIYDLQHQE